MRRRPTVLTLAAALVATAAAAPAATPVAELTARLRYDVTYLAATALEGRRAGGDGARIAAGFIARRLAALGLQPAGDDGTFLQSFSFVAGVRPGAGNALTVTLPAGTTAARLPYDFQPLAFSASGSAQGEVVFAGYGTRAPDLKYDDYANLDVKGKIVLILRFGPDGDDPASRFAPFMALRRKASEARAAGAAALLIATGPVGADAAAPVKISFDATFADSGLPVIGISTPFAESLFVGQGFTLAELQQRMNERKEPASRPLGIKVALTADVIQERATTANVLALLPGRDPALRDQVVIAGAHYDHLGWGGENSGSLAPETRAIHHGADDNASGTAGVLELARRLAAAPPARSVLFVAFSGEELGLLGSAHLASHLPVAKEWIAAMLNFDMIGRPKAGPALTVGGVGTAVEWTKVIADANATAHLKLTSNKGGFGASDHSSFYAIDTPVLFFFTGAHEDYHKPSDTADRLDYRGMGRVLEFATTVARRVADAPLPPTFQKVTDEGAGERRGFKVRTGAIPEYGFEGPGVKLSGARGGSPADKAGLKAGDIVVSFGGRDIRNIYDYMYALGDHKAGDVVTLVIKRGAGTLTLVVTLEASGGGGR